MCDADDPLGAQVRSGCSRPAARTPRVASSLSWTFTPFYCSFCSRCRRSARLPVGGGDWQFQWVLCSSEPRCSRREGRPVRVAEKPILSASSAECCSLSASLGCSCIPGSWRWFDADAVEVSTVRSAAKSHHGAMQAKSRACEPRGVICRRGFASRRPVQSAWWAREASARQRSSFLQRKRTALVARSRSGHSGPKISTLEFRVSTATRSGPPRLTGPRLSVHHL
jgi:hypothetical protein